MPTKSIFFNKILCRLLSKVNQKINLINTSNYPNYSFKNTLVLNKLIPISNVYVETSLYQNQT